MTIRLRLVLWYSGAFALSGFLLLLVVYLSFMRSLRSEVDRVIEDEFDEWCALSRELLREPEHLREEMAREVRSEPRVLISFRLRDTVQGADIVDAPGDGPFLPLRHAAPLPGVPARKRWSNVAVGENGVPWRVLEGPLDPAGHPGLAAQVTMEVSRIEQVAAALRGRSLLTAAVLFVLATAGGWVLASRSLKPIDEVAAELSRVESETLGERLALDGSQDEVARLRRAINRMLDRLQGAFEKQRHFTAAAAHELRSPLAVLRCRLELAAAEKVAPDPRAVVAEIFGEVDRLSSLVENLLLLARIDAEEGLPRLEGIDLAVFLAEVLEPFTLLADQKGVSTDLTCPAGIVLNGDAFLLRRLFGNLLDNAVRYTPEGGRVMVRAAPEANGCAVEVRDTGIGMDEAILARLFDRFFRAEESRTRDEGGAGLGLSIVKGVVDLHRGRIEVASRPGEGTRVRLWLPRTPSRT